MVTTARESNSTNNKEKKAISSPCSSQNSSHGRSSGTSTRTSSRRPSPTNNNGKSVPNYLNPTITSRHESFKYVIKKNNNSNEDTTKPSLLRRRSFDRPQSVSSPSSLVQKAIVSSAPRERSSRTLTVRAASFSSSKINASPRPIVDRISKTPKGTQSTTTTPATFSKNNVKKTSVSIPSKNEPLRKSASASSSKASSTPPPETPNNNNQENMGEHEEVALVHVDDPYEEMVNSVEEVGEVVPSELPNSVVNTEQVLINGDQEDEKKLDVITSSEEQQDMSKIHQLRTKTREEYGDSQCDQEETSSNSSQYQESTNLALTSGLESSQEEYDDKSKEINNPADDREILTKQETVDVENKLAEEGKEEVNDEGNKELGQNGDDTGVEVVEEEMKLPNIVAPTKPQGGSNHGRKESSPAYNDVIEETANKLLEKRKNKVKALVGAFETVIDYESSSK